MISVWINGQQRDEIDEGWIARTIQGLRHDGEDVCARISVKRMGLDLTMTAGVCPSGEGGRAPNPGERRIFDLWNGCGVHADPHFAPGRLIQCLKRLERAL